MNKKRLNSGIKERCLLTEVSPFETPILFSNWGSFNYLYNLKSNNPNAFVREVFSNNYSGIPYKFRIKKDKENYRVLYLIHPKLSEKITNLYKKFEIQIIKSCLKSKFSIRHPVKIGKMFADISTADMKKSSVEQFDENTAFSSSYFVYKDYSHLYKFFSSDYFTKLEKDYRQMATIDISKFFPTIYSHSISWAIRGKLESKDVAFSNGRDISLGGYFDNLIQESNYKETNGIIVGPEMSRIFAEIILQEIDLLTEKQLKVDGFLFGEHYTCARYIDDYFIFSNSKTIIDKFIAIIKEELEKYKLYLNETKTAYLNRPFISTISKKKIELKSFISQLKTEVLDSTLNKKLNSERELNKFRSIIGEIENNTHALSNYFFGLIQRNIKSLFEIDEEICLKAIIVFLDLTFYQLRTDTRVNNIIKVTNIIYMTLDITKKFKPYNRKRLNDKISSEIIECLKSSIESDCVIEALNLLIIHSELGINYTLDVFLLETIIEKSKKTIFEDRNPKERLTYFEIITILYYIKNKPLYSKIKEQILDEACNILTENFLINYSESCHLFFDLLSAPFLDVEEKIKICKAGVHFKKPVPSNKDQSEIIQYIEKHSWYFHWNNNNILRELLKKKKLQLSY
ncbi:DNA-binding protein [Leptospira kobayashii]|uniref:DNA-binding protein n=1 Tax=Leptospira kobayashii TaxID=1917830 RepID=A0ABN6KM23_9LEPT|nr:antiviral reverse transcriptase Drt3b [Leptospira kobayashii]BDA80196.1 DNA-binding protein [Leptospira kobayashii]